MLRPGLGVKPDPGHCDREERKERRQHPISRCRVCCISCLLVSALLPLWVLWVNLLTSGSQPLHPVKREREDVLTPSTFMQLYGSTRTPVVIQLPAGSGPQPTVFEQTLCGECSNKEVQLISAVTSTFLAACEQSRVISFLAHRVLGIEPVC